MKKFIIITGPMGVGKTTTGKMLSDRLGKTAFIDGDWCIDIHPFVGNKETKGMAINNIVHMTRNYYHCKESDYIVLSWVMSQNTISKIIMGISDLNLKVYTITLHCSEDALIKRWNQDQITEWREDYLLKESIQSINHYKSREESIRIDTSELSIEEVVDVIVKQL